MGITTMANETETLIKTLLETQIIQALNNAPDAIEKMIKAALSKPVDRGGNLEGERNFSSYGGTMPYLDWMVGEEIRRAATTAARKVIGEQTGTIEEQIRKGLSSDSVVAAVTKSFLDAATQEWRIKVEFQTEKDR